MMRHVRHPRRLGWPIGALVTLGLVTIVCATGYIMNFVKLWHVVEDPINMLMILRAVGVFAPPLGIILGYL